MAENSEKILINCIVADDEPLARIGMIRLIEETPFLKLVGVAKDVREIREYIHTGKVDLIFLDIQMPEETGIEFLKTQKNPPKVIITTAYPEYAIEGYELDILDYLLKPVTLQRFLKAANKAREYFEYLVTTSNTDEKNQAERHLFIKTDGKLEKVLLSEILYIEAKLNYVVIVTGNKKMITYASIKKMQAELGAGRFLKIHKSYIVAVSKIDAYDGKEVKIRQHTIPVSRPHREELRRLLR